MEKEKKKTFCHKSLYVVLVLVLAYNFSKLFALLIRCIPWVLYNYSLSFIQTKSCIKKFKILQKNICQLSEQKATRNFISEEANFEFLLTLFVEHAQVICITNFLLQERKSIFGLTMLALMAVRDHARSIRLWSQNLLAIFAIYKKDRSFFCGATLVEVTRLSFDYLKISGNNLSFRVCIVFISLDNSSEIIFPLKILRGKGFWIV